MPTSLPNPTAQSQPLRRRTLISLLPLALGGGLAAQAQEPTRLDKIKASGVLKVAIYKDNAPYSDGPVAEMQGVDVSLAQALARQLQVKLSLLPFDAGENMGDDLRNMVWRGHYLGYGPADVMLHVPVDKHLMNENRQAHIFAPYARESLVVLHRLAQIPAVKNANDLLTHKLGVERGSGAASVLIGYQSGLLREQVSIFDSGLLAAQAALAGKVVAAYVSRAQAEAALFQAKAQRADWGLSPLSLQGIPENGWPLGMAVKADQKDLAIALEAAMQSLRSSGELLALFRQHGLTLAAP